ncbi:hypothetical protein LOC68_24325 [Blastopirellula sp. JC732]|uniref:DUF4476 domain-containing protein n=1 Tax=Blastopirellula sediminis TaxID=2894196 RepID=A0A9X1MSF6_9BACT|nr:hypothetical protein [Blastopirellula sediminis]MCC9605165.1 hypothetical protein [Blastopirellula sediminis]MCC9631535.1 hypothetical protein [Blastopirellula sediminis]
MRKLLFLSALLSPCFAGILCAQVVQLPEVHNFSVGTSVLVPDRGMTYGGGVLRRSESSGQVGSFSIPSGRSYSSSSSSQSSWVKAYIHPSPAEMDEILLGNSARPQPQDAASLRMIGAGDLNQRATNSLAAIRRQLSAEDAVANQKALKYADMAEDCLKEGKTSIAKLFLRSAISTARGDYQVELKERLKEISDTATAKR